jgi:hypothetical protein
MALFKLLEAIARFNADERGHSGDHSRGVSLGAAWAITMCLAVVGLFILSNCGDPDPFKGF